MNRKLILSLAALLASVPAAVWAQNATRVDTTGREIRVVTPERDVVIRIEPDGDVIVDEDGEPSRFRMHALPRIAERMSRLDGELRARLAPGAFAFRGGDWSEWADTNRTRVFTMAPEPFGYEFFRDGFWFGGLGESREEIVRMEQETRELADRARRAEGAERTRLERELSDRLAELFDEKEEARAERVRQLEERLQQERGRLDERRRARDEIVERRKRQLLGERDQLEW